jgi:hypothetical protein
MTDYEYMDKGTQEAFVLFSLVSLAAALIIASAVVYFAYRITSICI